MLNGKMFRDAIISAAVTISNKKRIVDELNVFPVPDGDTGTNMSMTMGGALRELALEKDNAEISKIAETAASALLRGARGNSGVILSLLFRGFLKGFSGKSEAGLSDIRKALELGVEGAYKSVMNPTEGTILTVARLCAEKAKEAETRVSDLVSMWEIICEEAKTAVANTTEQLPVLKKAGVVDAGGMGLLIIYQAMLEVFKGAAPAKPDDSPVGETPVIQSSGTVVGDSDEEITYTYCTEYIVNKDPSAKDPQLLRAFLETIGDSVVCVDDDEIIKAHVHTEHPGTAIEEGIKFGTLINLKIDNMRYQHEKKARESSIAKQRQFTPAEPVNEFGFVSVASGAGIEEMFKNLGTDCIVRGGQTMNPSTDDILQAIYATPAKTVFILPNNKNIIMAAQQAAKLSDRNACVIQTKTIPQGITAVMAFDPEADFEINRLNMTKAIEKVSTGLVTFAARNSEFDGRNIRQGEILALSNGKLSFTAKDVSKAAYKLVKKLINGESSFVTLIYGADVTDERAEALAESLRERLGGEIEVILINGGQPVYYYIISVE